MLVSAVPGKKELKLHTTGNQSQSKKQFLLMKLFPLLTKMKLYKFLLQTQEKKSKCAPYSNCRSHRSKALGVVAAAEEEKEC